MKKLYIVALCFFVISNFCKINVGQGVNDNKNRDAMDRNNNELLNRHNAEMLKLGNSDRDDYIDAGENAILQLYTSSKKPTELRSLVRKLEEIQLDLLSNDAGRLIAKNEQTVRIFIGFDTDSLQLSDRAIMRRLTRLEGSIGLLKNFNPSQGMFDSTKSQAVKNIAMDALWVSDMRDKVSSRIALIEAMIAKLPKRLDVSNLKTLEEVKRDIIATDVLNAESARLATSQAASSQALVNELDAQFNRDVAESDTIIAQKNIHAEFNRQAIEAEYAVKRAVVEARIAMFEAEKLKIEQAKREAVQNTQQQRVVAYLTSPRVKQLLGPFCNSGFAKPCSKTRRYPKSQPMSLNGLTNAKFNSKKQNPLGSKDYSIGKLVNIANFVPNDRGAWSTSRDEWHKAGNTFQSMSGEMVNPYREAHRILREHGQTLVDLGMLEK